MAEPRTETFNESAVSNDFKSIMEFAETIRNVLNKGTTDIEEKIGNSSINDAYSGYAGSKIREQWADLANTFEAFMRNFQNWYDQSVETAKANASLQQETSNVEGVDA